MRSLIQRREPLMRGVMHMGEFFRTRISEMPFAEPPEVRVEGLAIAIDRATASRGLDLLARAVRT